MYWDRKKVFIPKTLITVVLLYVYNLKKNRLIVITKIKDTGLLFAD